MRSGRHHRTGFTLLELLCVIAIITILAGLLLGPVSRALQKARAMKWGNEAPVLLDATVTELRRHFRGMRDFPPVTLELLETGRLLEEAQLRFLKDRRVRFFPFTGADADDRVVIEVRIDAGVLVAAGTLRATKGEITRPPE